MDTIYLTIFIIFISVLLSVVVNVTILRKGAEITAKEVSKVEQRIMKQINRQ